MTDIHTRIVGRAGRITLTRPKALNALSYEMCLEVERALNDWREADIDLIVIDAEGDRAFCAGGDIEQIYDTGKAGDFGFARKFWADEYRMNFKMTRYPKPIVPFMQGFTMGGGVGVACHGSHRVVGDSSQIAMPECGIGLVPDVGGSLILARAPGRLGEFLGLSGTRMGPGDAIYAGFADVYIPEADWPALIAQLEDTGDIAAIDRAAKPAPEAPLKAHQEEIDRIFAGNTLEAVATALPQATSAPVQRAAKAIGHNSPLSMACTLDMIARVREADTMTVALNQEYRFTYRAAEKGDLLEGIRAQIIDKDRNPQWKHKGWQDLPHADILAMTMPIPGLRLDFDTTDIWEEDTK